VETPDHKYADSSSEATPGFSQQMKKMGLDRYEKINMIDDNAHTAVGID
jgi:hypothetical protein